MVNVLIVDDNAGIEIVRILISTFLRREGIPIDVRVYPTIRDAEKRCRKPDKLGSSCSY